MVYTNPDVINAPLIQFRNKRPKLAKKTKILIIGGVSASVAIITIVVLCVVLTGNSSDPYIHFKFTESFDQIPNPERGWHMHQDSLDFADGSLNWLLTTWRDSYTVNYVPKNTNLKVFGTVLFVKVNLKNSKALANIPSAKLTEIRQAFTNVRNNNLKVIFRPAYDYDGVSKPEPAQISTVLTHLADLAPVINDNKDVILGVQFGLIGPWGEMHSSIYNGKNGQITYENAVKQIGDKYLQLLDPEIKIMVRKPSDIGLILGKDSYTDISTRIGLYNDALYTNADDYGTLDPFDKTNTTIQNYIQQTTKYSISVGETFSFQSTDTDIKGNYSTFNNVVKEAGIQHITSQNLWGFTEDFNGPANGDDSYFRWSDTSFKKFTNMMGYRWVLLNLSYQNAKGHFEGHFSLKNVGLAAIVHKRPVNLVIMSGNIVQKTAINTDPSSWYSTEEYKILFDVTTKQELIGQKCDIYLEFPDKDAALALKPLYSVRLANSDVTWDDATGLNKIISDLVMQ
ncbi:DUF4832_domain-containing protein [Hexamita inflata]|uniref:Partial n=1 Tax=Hexamita inflata TaxID=28002 RepID=A0ABP1JF83_9EUKA